MNLRKTALGLFVLVFLGAGVGNARTWFSSILPQEKQESRIHTIGRGEALALYSAQQQQPSFKACSDQFPGGNSINPRSVLASMKPLTLCSDNFAVLYSQTSKTPLVVVERLSATQLEGAKAEVRTNQFFPDPRIPKSGRAELSDYPCPYT